MIRIVPLLKWTLFAVVLAFVIRYAHRLWMQSDVHTSLRAASVGWLAISAALYLASWLPSVWFWRALMRELGGQVDFVDAARAYYCGHLGKYVPGKAMVLVIRAALVKDRGASPAAATLAVIGETLAMMATGVVVGLAFAPLQEWMTRKEQTALAIVALLGLAASSLVAPKILGWLGRKTGAPNPLPAAAASRIRTSLVFGGCAAFFVAWLIQGLSLGATLQAVTDGQAGIGSWPTWTGAMALSTSLGFAVLFAPAGIGVREFLLMGVLAGEHVPPRTVVAAAVLSRVVSLVSEVGLSAVLYFAIRRPPSSSPGD